MPLFRQHLSVKPLVSLVAGAILITLLVYFVDPSRLYAQASRIPLLAILQFGASVLVFHILRSIRWRSLLRRMEADPSFGTVFWTNMIGYGVNAFVPVRFGGELARAYVIESKARIGFFPSLSSIAVERILDLLAIVGLATLGAISYSSATNQVSFLLILLSTGTVTVAMLAVVLIGSRNLPAVTRFFRWTFSKIPMRNSWRERLLNVVESTLAGVASIGRDRRLVGVSVALSTAIWIANFAGFYALFLAVGFTGPIQALLLAIMLFQLSFILPSTPGNVGTFEGFLVLFVGALGLEAIDATLAVGVVGHIVNLFIVGGLSIAGAFLLGLRLKDLFRIPSKKKHASKGPLSVEDQSEKKD